MKQGFLLFHINMLFSAISEDLYDAVIRKCYWSILNLCENYHLPLNVELSKVSYEIINKRDPAWVVKLQELVEGGLIEIVESGYTQLIGPLVPEDLLKENLAHRVQASSSVSSFLVNEMALDLKTLAVYRNQKITKILFEEESVARLVNTRPSEMTRYSRLRFDDLEPQEVVWVSSMLFQQFQRYIHGSSSLSEYLEFFERDFDKREYVSVYSSDAEIFNFRPGRYKNESNKYTDNEWDKIAKLVELLRDRIDFVRIKDLKLLKNEVKIQFTASNSNLVKKQRKYNLNRWYVSGRNDTFINSECLRAYKVFEQLNCEERQELLYLWSSDFRTHIHEDRWNQYLQRLSTFSHRIEDRYKNIKPKLCKENEMHNSSKFVFLLDKDNGSIQKVEHDGVLLMTSLKHSDFEYTDEASDFFSGGMIVFDQIRNSIATDYDFSNKVVTNYCDTYTEFVYEESDSNFSLVKTVRRFKNCNSHYFNWSISCSEESRRLIRFGNFLFAASGVEAVGSSGRKTNYYFPLKDYGEKSLNESMKISSSQCIPQLTDSLLVYFKSNVALEFKITGGKTLNAAPLLSKLNLNGQDFFRLSYSVSEIDDTSRLRKDVVDFGLSISCQNNIKGPLK